MFWNHYLCGHGKIVFYQCRAVCKKGDFEGAEEQIRQGDEAYTQGHHIHADLLTLDANGKLEESGLILMHAEDQLMSAETFRVLAVEFIEVYKKMAS